jgi:hypothetical protein
MTRTALRLGAALLLSLAAVSASANPAQTRPFNLNGAILEVPGPSPRCPSQFGGTIVGHGESAVTGKVAFISSDCITPSGTLFNFTDGRLTIVTITGEQIFANYSGQFVPTGEGTKYIFSGATFQITGGSGRYSKASGGGTLSGGEDMAGGAGTLQLDGTITY